MLRLCVVQIHVHSLHSTSFLTFHCLCLHFDSPLQNLHVETNGVATGSANTKMGGNGVVTGSGGCQSVCIINVRVIFVCNFNNSGLSLCIMLRRLFVYVTLIRQGNLYV